MLLLCVHPKPKGIAICGGMETFSVYTDVHEAPQREGWCWGWEMDRNHAQTSSLGTAGLRYRIAKSQEF